MFLSEWREFPSAPCLTGTEDLMTACVWILLKSRASLTCFRACFLPGRAKDLSAPAFIVRFLIFEKYPNIKFHAHPTRDEADFIPTDGQTHMTKLSVAFQNFVNAAKNWIWSH